MIEAKRTCEVCGKKKPESKFLPSQHSPTGRLPKCIDCIRKAAEGHRIDRERRDARDVKGESVGTTRRSTAVVVAKPAPAPRLPMKGRLDPELEAAALRFAIGWRDGQELPHLSYLEPPLRAVLEWMLAEACAVNEAKRGPEQLGQDLLGFKDERTARGVAHGALWASLVRLANLYKQADADAHRLEAAKPAAIGRRRK